jgi:two-component system nitrogen regulation sensor histidine kinase NtrY
MSLARQVPTWAGRIGLWRKITVTLAIAAPVSGIATYLLLTGPQPVGAHPQLVLPMLYLDLTLLLALAALVAKRLVEVWAERRRGIAGSRMQVKLVGLFSLIAVLPTIIVAVFSYLFFSFGVETWFSDRVRTAITESVAVADAYVKEHVQAIRGDALSMAADINHNASALIMNPQYLGPILTAQAAMRGLTEAAIVDGKGKMVEGTGLVFALGFEDVNKDALHRASQGEVVIMTDDTDERVRALVKLDNFSDLYLYVGRFIEPKVLKHREETQLAAAQYEKAEGQRSGFQITFAVVFILVAMLFLAAAISIGINFAGQLTDPISRLVNATEQVSAGDLTTRVPEGKKDDELASLSRAFNRMTNQLESQQREVIEANRQLDERRRFTEAVLTGVSAGVIGLDHAGRINLPNRSASALLGVDLDAALGEDLAEVAPEMGALLEEATRRPDRLAQAQVQIAGANSTRTLLVRIAAERDHGEISGFVLTFDDITELLSAQRKAAWADIARRIAHEIKNPLTPIQLAAERLRRNYLKEIKKEPEIFKICTDTIVRHVEDIGRMVDEFSSFARMPQPVLKQEDLRTIVERAVFLQRQAHSDIAFDIRVPSQEVPLRCDGRLVGQAVVNITKNAIESIEGRIAEDAAAGRPTVKGQLSVGIEEGDGQVVVAVEDNGKGLPRQGRERLTEPYVTTRAKGTGLGLAIVKKIMEDHQGELALEDREPRGARITLAFMRDARAAARPDASVPPAELSTVDHGA